MSPDKPYKVFHKDIWRGDSWDACEFGQELRTNRSFSEQFNDLLLAVPVFHINHMIPCHNSDYCNPVCDVKDSYLAFSGSFSEGILYTYWFGNCKNCIDCSHILECEQCFNCIDCR